MEALSLLAIALVIGFIIYRVKKSGDRPESKGTRPGGAGGNRGNTHEK